MENPYQAPQTTSPAVGVLSGSHEDLRSVAKYQKGIIFCILIYLLAVIGQFALPPEIRPFAAIGVLLIALGGAICVLLLAMKVYGTGLGILLGILCLVPCVGLLVLLAVNGRATNVLRKNGINVGLLGADISSI